MHGGAGAFSDGLNSGNYERERGISVSSVMTNFEHEELAFNPLDSQANGISAHGSQRRHLSVPA